MRLARRKVVDTGLRRHDEVGVVRGAPSRAVGIPARLENPALLSGSGMTAPCDRFPVAMRTSLRWAPVARPDTLPQRERRRFVGLLRVPAG